MNNIVKNYITSIMGIILFLFGFLAFWFDKIGWLELIGVAFAGALLLTAKDGLLKKITFGLLKIDDK